MSSTIPLAVTAQVKLNGTGSGTVSVGPKYPGEIWFPSLAAVNVSTNVKEATGVLWQGVQPGILQLGTTQTASTGDSTDLPGSAIYPGTSLWFVWSGGDAGSVANLSIVGQRQVP